MKLGWFLIVVGGGYLLFRISYAILWALYSTVADPLADVPYMLIQAVIIGGLPLSWGIWRLLRHKRARKLQ
jgi:hypothetical protein